MNKYINNDNINIPVNKSKGGRSGIGCWWMFSLNFESNIISGRYVWIVATRLIKIFLINICNKKNKK